MNLKKLFCVLLIGLALTVTPSYALVTAENPRISYVAGGGAGDVNFSYSYKIFQSTDLLVYDDNILKTLNVHYTVSMNAGGVGGTVTFITAPVAASIIDIVRSIPLTQNMDLVEGARLPSETLESTLDKQTMTLQDMDSKLSLLLAGGGITPIDVNTILAMMGYIDVRRYASINSAITLLGSTICTLYVPNAQTLTTNLVIPSTMSVVIPKGGSIVKASTYNITINGPLEAGLYQIFSGFDAGDVTGTFKEVYPEWWGIDGTTDQTEIQMAVNSLSVGKVVLSNKTYNTTDEVLISNHRVGIVGQGPKASHINFVPTSNNKIAIRIKYATGVQIVQNYLRDFSIGSTDTTYQKTGIKLVDVSEFRLQNIAINPLNDVGFTSVGMEIAGRDVSSLIDLEINSDIPIYVTKNPNTATSDMTGFNFHNQYFIATSTNPIIKISSNCWVVGLSITGHNTWIAGKYGIYMADTETNSAMYNWTIDTVIWEQVTEAGGYFMFLSPNTKINNITLRNMYNGPTGQANGNGFYFRKCESVVLDNCAYYGTGIPYNLDDTVYPFELRNFYSPIGGSAPATANLRPAHKITSATGLINYGLWTDPATTYGNFSINKIGALVNSATPSVSDGNVFLTGGTTTITNFTGGWTGQEIKIISEHAITITDGTNIFLSGSANYVMDATDTLTLINKADGKWYELSRSNN